MNYDYGDEVRLTVLNERGESVDRPAAVVGITEVAAARQSEALGHPVGTILYTVEFADGSDQLVPEDQLAPGA
jgi:hypothetical protein